MWSSQDEKEGQATVRLTLAQRSRFGHQLRSTGAGLSFQSLIGCIIRGPAVQKGLASGIKMIRAVHP